MTKITECTEKLLFINQFSEDIHVVAEKNKLNEQLYEAAKIGDLDGVKGLVEAGADNFSWAMDVAAASNHIEVMKFCKKQGACNLDWAFWSAAEHDNIEAMLLLKSWGAMVYESILCDVDARKRPEVAKLLKKMDRISET